MRSKLLLIAILLAVLTIGSTTVGAAGPVTVTIQSSSFAIVNRLAISVPVAVVCDPLSGTPWYSNVSVTIQQASGQGIIQASATLNSNGGSPFLTCDGTTTNLVTVQVVPTSNDLFHGGGAIVSATASYTTCGYVFYGFCYYPFTTESGQSTLVPVNLKG